VVPGAAIVEGEAVVMSQPQSGFGRALWIAIALVFIVAWCGYLALVLPGRGDGDLATPDLTRRPGPGEADYGWPLRDMHGAAVDLEPYRGKPLLLNVWATWCGPCIREMPSIENLAANPRLKDVGFVCVSTDQDIVALQEFIKERKPKVTIYRSLGAAPRIFDSPMLPTTFIIAPDGRILHKEVGAMQWDVPEVVDRLEALAKGRADNVGPWPKDKDKEGSTGGPG
jgi:thiol-disulfide isomerase/thioredoxin